MVSPNLFVHSDGSLWNARRKRTVRERYSYHSAIVRSTSDVRAALRAGPYAWPGGYALAFLMNDGGALCFDCARQEYRQLSYAIRNRLRDGWRVEGIVCEEESDDGCMCDHCGKTIWEAKEE